MRLKLTFKDLPKFLAEEQMKHLTIFAAACFILALIINQLTIVTNAKPSDFNTNSLAKCATPANARDAMKQSATVFSGEISQVYENGGEITLKFKVAKFWKGNLKKTVSVKVSTNAVYSPTFKAGEKFLVYAWADNGQFYTGRCSRTKELTYAGDDLRALGKGKVPK
jgi:hypothetical protein